MTLGHDDSTINIVMAIIIIIIIISDHTDIFINQRTESNLNSTITLRHSTQNIMPFYTHKNDDRIVIIESVK